MLFCFAQVALDYYEKAEKSKCRLCKTGVHWQYVYPKKLASPICLHLLIEVTPRKEVFERFNRYYRRSVMGGSEILDLFLTDPFQRILEDRLYRKRLLNYLHDETTPLYCNQCMCRGNRY